MENSNETGSGVQPSPRRGASAAEFTGQMMNLWAYLRLDRYDLPKADYHSLFEIPLPPVTYIETYANDLRRLP